MKLDIIKKRAYDMKNKRSTTDQNKKVNNSKGKINFKRLQLTQFDSEQSKIQIVNSESVEDLKNIPIERMSKK